MSDEAVRLEAECERLAAENAAIRKRLYTACDHLREDHGRHSIATHLVSNISLEPRTRRVLAAVELAEAVLEESPMPPWPDVDAALAAYRATGTQEET